MSKVIIVGAGQLGSRHLQALSSVGDKLSITVVDTSEESLFVAEERYKSVDPDGYNTVEYLMKIPENGAFDIAIIPTNAKVRSSVVKALLEKNSVKYIILEKILFTKKEDYNTIAELLKEKGCKAWVNCSMRKSTFYSTMSEMFAGEVIDYNVSGSQYGLITNAIHYIDHMAFITGCSNFTVNSEMLDKSPIGSKRQGYLELNGTLTVKFEDGSTGTFTCFPDGELPMQVEIFSKSKRMINREWEGKAWLSSLDNSWTQEEIDAPIPFQSQMTTELVKEILDKGTCPLVSFEESSKIHLQLQEPLLEFLNSNCGGSYDYYPFT